MADKSEYNKTDDHSRFTAGRIDLGEGKSVVVRVRQYQDGPLKLSIETEGERKNGGTWSSGMKRIPMDLLPEILPLVAKCQAFVAKKTAAPAAAPVAATG